MCDAVPAEPCHTSAPESSAQASATQEPETRLLGGRGGPQAPVRRKKREDIVAGPRGGGGGGSSAAVRCDAEVRYPCARVLGHDGECPTPLPPRP